MDIVADFSQWRRQAKGFANGLSSISITLAKSGRGEIYTSPREPMKGERGKPLHGRAIANILRTKGGDVFALPAEFERRMVEKLRLGVGEIFRDCLRSGRPAERRMRRLLQECTEATHGAIVDRTKAGRVKANSGKYASKKRDMAALDYVYWITSAAGPQPLWGVRSGRFLDGIKFRLSRSKRALSSVYLG